MDKLECEYHVLLVCPKYRNLRINVCLHYYCHWPTYHKFESLSCDLCDIMSMTRSLRTQKVHHVGIHNENAFGTKFIIYLDVHCILMSRDTVTI